MLLTGDDHSGVFPPGVAVVNDVQPKGYRFPEPREPVLMMPKTWWR